MLLLELATEHCNNFSLAPFQNKQKDETSVTQALKRSGTKTHQSGVGFTVKADEEGRAVGHE